MIASWKLVDVKQRKGKFTWNNKQFGPGHIVVRLDRILVSSSILDKPFLPVSILLTTTVSDHKPIIFSLDPIGNLGPQPFKFSPVWLTEPGIHDVVSQAWGLFVHGSPTYIWEQKQFFFKKEVKAWLARGPRLG